MQDTAPNQYSLAMVYQRPNGQATLEPIIVNGSDTGQQVFENVRKKQYELSRMESPLWFFNLLTTRLEVGIGEIGWALTDQKGAESSGARVDLKGFIQVKFFSEAIRHPGLLAHEHDFLVEYGSLALSNPDERYGFIGQQVLVVSPTADKEKIGWLLLLSLILSPALGLVVGQFTHRAEVGVAVSAGVFACASFLQGLAAWIHK